MPTDTDAAVTGKAGNRRTAATPRTRRSKGEQTRRRILDAVLGVVAREGIRGVTHRAVAAEAGVQLSLTTYYFEDIEAMIREAFAQFSELMRPELEVLWDDLFEYLEGFTAADLRRKAVREEVCEKLTQQAAHRVVTQIKTRPAWLAVEQIFFTQTRLSPELRSLGLDHRQRLLEPLVRLCRRFNSRDPEINAELLLNTITALEYQALATPPELLDEELIRRLLRRNIGWVVGLRRA